MSSVAKLAKVFQRRSQHTDIHSMLFMIGIFSHGTASLWK